MASLTIEFFLYSPRINVFSSVVVDILAVMGFAVWFGSLASIMLLRLRALISYRLFSAASVSTLVSLWQPWFGLSLYCDFIVPAWVPKTCFC